jgi:hypothetical protein
MSNLIKVFLKCTNVNSWPLVKIKTVDTEFKSITIDQEFVNFSVPITGLQSKNVIIVERYGKTELNQLPDVDQTVEILSVTVDNIAVPDFILEKFSRFEFANQCHVGSKFFGPNGTWIFDFETPFITWILDQKILHESQYNQDYIYPWSYKFGPDSVDVLNSQLLSVTDKVRKLL